MKSILNPFVILLLITVLSCQKKHQITYKYADKTPISCSNTDTKLISEAIYTFKEDILNAYDKNNKNFTRAITIFIRNASTNSVDYKAIASPHTRDVLEALKAQKNLWNTENPNSNLNYKSAIIKCIAENLTDADLKTTFNALLTTNSLRYQLLEPVLNTKSRLADNDNYLAAYMALELYYAKLINVDFSTEKKAATNI